MTQEVDDFLAHYGVKGMKWGVHKKEREPITFDLNKRNRISRRPTTQEIKDARSERKSLQGKIKDLDKQYGKDPETGLMFLSKEHSRVYKELLEGDNHAISIYKTRGEQAAAALLLGPIGALHYSDFNRGRRVANRNITR